MSRPLELVRWLTVPEVCAYLHITETEWQQWRQRGQTPLHRIDSTDRIPRVRRADLNTWMDSLPEEDFEALINELTPVV